jgi:hypothetical protein
MSPTEIRLALAWYDDVFGELDGLATTAPRTLKKLAEAARAYADLLDQGVELEIDPLGMTNRYVESGRYLVVRIGDTE